MKKNPIRAAAIACCAAMMLPLMASPAKKSNDSAAIHNLNTFSSIVKELQLNYVDSLAIEKNMRTAIDAMLSTIDPYTEYYSEQDREDFEKMTTGEYGGVGSYITEKDGYVSFSGPFEGSPADKAGIKSGDRILVIGTDSMRGKTSQEVSNALRGKPGSQIDITVQRPYVADSILTLTVTREKISTPSVPYYGLVGKDSTVGYIRLTQFIDKSPAEVKSALDKFRERDGLKGVILDLRGNGGGLLESSVEILGYFLPKGTEVLRTRGRAKDSERIFKTTGKPLMADVPLVVLIDGGTASASEITAGAIQDLDRGVLIGTRSFGKGLVQGSRPLPYNGLLKLTVAKYYIPSGRLIQALDYSRRNPDGSVAFTPDSLTKVFHTAAGREVRDGGGLTPDVEVSWGENTRLIYNLIRDGWIFDYATKYAAEHPEIEAPEDFVITDETYADFKSSINADKFKYDKACEDIMANLRKAAELEGYLNDETKAQLDTLAKLLTHDLNHDLDIKRPEISQYLAEEIVSRYYYDKGKIVQELKTDPGLAKALEILGNPAEYSRLLTAPKTKK